MFHAETKSGAFLVAQGAELRIQLGIAQSELNDYASGFWKIGIRCSKVKIARPLSGQAIDCNVPCGVFAPSWLDQRSDFDFCNLGGPG